MNHLIIIIALIIASIYCHMKGEIGKGLVLEVIVYFLLAVSKNWWVWWI